LILADTHAWFWWLTESPKLSVRARRAMERQPVAIASISLWEIALLASRGRIELAMRPAEWLSIAVSRPDSLVLEISPAIAATGAGFGAAVHNDPADRIIMATALVHNLQLVTADERMTSSGLVRTVW
jgi:PIN domain nuclease of toxin-antitoxin system